MSFASSAHQLKQRQNAESPLERGIKANITRMQDSIRSASEQVERVSRGSSLLYVKESFDEFLVKSKAIQEETEQLFRDWTIDLASEPNERIRKKFTFEKLQRTFDEEVVNLRNVTKQVLEAQKTQQANAAVKQSLLRPSREAQNDSFEEDDQLLLDDDEEQLTGLAALQNRLSAEREAGIAKIQGQVSEVHQMFRDIAGIVTDQAHDLELIEENAEETYQETKGAVSELKKAAKRQRTNSDRFKCIIAVLLVILLWFIVPNMHMLDRRNPSALPGSSESSSMNELTQVEEPKVEGPKLPEIDAERSKSHAQPSAEEEKEDENPNS